MWDYWFEGFVIFMLLGISGRIFLMARQLENFHDCFHHFEDRVFNPQEEVHVHEGTNLRVMGLEDFMDEFGFDHATPKTRKRMRTIERRLKSGIMPNYKY